MKKVSLLTKDDCGSAMYKSLSALSFLIAGTLFSAAAWSATPQQLDQAKRIHERLTGVPPLQADLTAMADLIANGTTDSDGYTGADAAANYAIKTGARKSEFYTTHLKNFFVEYTNIDANPLPLLNDAAATMIGMVRDDVPFDQVLYGDILYVPAAGYSGSSNANYEAMDQSHADLSSNSVLVASTQTANSPVTGLESSSPKFAGVVTTRAWGEAYYSAGTNRRVWRSVAINFLCRDMEQLKDTTRSPDRVRQDVTRSPGGDSSIYLSACVGCHSGMDPLVGAYAYYEWTNDDHLTYNTHIHHDPDNGVLHKFLINAGNFPQGYVTHDDSWENYWREGKNAELGWGEATLSAPTGAQPPKVVPPAGVTNTGNGPTTLGEEVASTSAFSICQVERVYRDVCKHEPTDANSADLKTLQNDFMTNGFNMKSVFIKTAAMCAGD